MQKYFVTVGLLLIAKLLSAGGFQVSLQGSKQIGMAHVGTAIHQDASVLYFNPAGMSWLEKRINVQAGFYPIFARIGYREPNPGIYSAYQVPQMGTPFSVYFTSKIKDKIGIGLGIYTPFGSGSKWADDWKGRYVIQEVDLKTVFIQPSISYAINDKITIGAGFIYAIGNVFLAKAVPLADTTFTYGRGELSGNAKGIGANVGVMFKPSNDWSIGINYKTKVKTQIDNGTATFVVPSALKDKFPTTDFTSSITLPQIITGGIAYKKEKYTVGLDVNYTGWKSYDTLKFDYATNTDALDDTKSTKLWSNTLTVRLGAQYNATEKVKIRAGVYYDQSASQNEYVSPETPDPNKIVVTTGASYHFNKVSIDAGLGYVHGLDVDKINPETNFGGLFRSRAVIPSIGLNVNL